MNPLALIGWQLLHLFVYIVSLFQRGDILQPQACGFLFHVAEHPGVNDLVILGILDFLKWHSHYNTLECVLVLDWVFNYDSWDISQK